MFHPNPYVFPPFHNNNNETLGSQLTCVSQWTKEPNARQTWLMASNSNWNCEPHCISFLFFFPLSPLNEASGSSKVSLSKFLLSNSSCDKHGEMLRNTTPRKPKGQQRLWLILLGEEQTPEPGWRFSEADLLEAPTPLHTSPAASARSGLPLKYHLAVTNYS